MFDIIGRGEKRSGGWLWERYGSDFVFKNGRWLYVHEQVCPDFGSSYDGTNWYRIPARHPSHIGRKTGIIWRKI